MIWLLLVSFILFFPVAAVGEIRYDKGSRRDPFEPLLGPHAFQGARGLGKAAFPVEGIIFDPQEGSYAVIGGEIYREGESVNGAKLIKILPDRVILLQESEQLVIWLREEILEAGEKK